MIIALCAFMTGSILIATLPVHQIYWAQIFVTTLVTPFGMDMSFPAATLVVSDSVEKSKQGVAASLVNTIVSGFSVFMIILQPSKQSSSNKNFPQPLNPPPLPHHRRKNIIPSLTINSSARSTTASPSASASQEP